MSQLRSVVERFNATRDARLTRDLALVVARFALAWIFIFHGASTLFGFFGGAGLHAEAVYFSQTAHLHPGTFFALMAGIIECFGGIAVGIGVFGRLAAAAIVGDMIMAMITVTYALAAVVALLGTGRFSLDAFIRSSLKR